VGQDEDLVLEALRPVGDLCEMEVLPGARTVAVALLDEGAFEKEDFRSEDLRRGEAEEACRRVPRIGDKGDRDLAGDRLASRRRRPNVLRPVPFESGKELPFHLRREEPECRDAVVDREGGHGEIAPDEDRDTRFHPLDARVVPDPFEPLVEGEDLAPERDGVRVRPRDASRHPLEPPLRAPVGEPRRVVEMGVREEEVRNGHELGRGAPEVKREPERREVKPGLAPGGRDPGDGKTGEDRRARAFPGLPAHPPRVPVLYWGLVAHFNHTTRELTAKIVYYGPALGGKTTNLRTLHAKFDHASKWKLLSLATAQERTIYFDLLPVELGNIKGYTVRFQLCTVPGQVFYNETRKILLRGVDGIVFVVDSQPTMLSGNLESFQNLRENLREEKIALKSLPVVIQYNKRDLPASLPVGTLQESLDLAAYPFVEASATEGTGIIETFRLVSKLTFVDLLRRLQKGDPGVNETAGAALVAATEAEPNLASEAPEMVFAQAATALPVTHEPSAVFAEPEPPPAGAEPDATEAESLPASSGLPPSMSFEDLGLGEDSEGWESTSDDTGPDFDDELSLDSPLMTSHLPDEADLAATRAIPSPTSLPPLLPPGEWPAPTPEAVAVESPEPSEPVEPSEPPLSLLPPLVDAWREEAEERLGARLTALEEEISVLRSALAESRIREDSLESRTEELQYRWDSLRKLLSEDEPQGG